MTLPDSLYIRVATPQDRSRLANLIHFESNVHRHLDWRPPLDWLGHTPNLVAETDAQLLAALFCPPDPPEVAWVRLFAASNQVDRREAWEALWPVARDQLEEQAGCRIAAIPIQSWFRDLVAKSGFTHTHDIVTLTWEGGRQVPPGRRPPAAIRPMREDDLPVVSQVDNAAFGPLWRNSLASLRIAFEQAAIATVAEDDDGIVGYQISTPTPVGGHLARLAVLPECQGQGIGYALVRDVLTRFQQRRAWRVTVNTQKDNLASLRLYSRAGFQPSGETYPVYLYQPEPPARPQA